MLETRRWGPTTGPQIVLLHEGLGSVGLWRDFPEKLAEATGRGVFAWSRAGYGASDPPPLPRPVRYMHDEAALLPELLRELDRPWLFGHSDGASIALIAAGNGFCSRGLILEAPHVFAEDVSIRSIRAARDEYEKGALRSKLARWHQNVDAAFYGWNRPWLDPEFLRWNLEELLPRITAPILLVQGKDDEYGTTAQLDAIRAGARGPVETLLLDSCGHSPHRDQPAAVLAATTRFCARTA